MTSSPARCVLVSVPHGAAAGNLLRTGIVRRLLESDSSVRLVLLSPLVRDPEFARETAHPRVELEELPPHCPQGLEARLLALMQDETGLAALCFIMVGALAGFLWWNAYPARLFMGDAGALPLGGMLAIVALLSGWWLLLPLIGIIYVVEALSVIIQITYFRRTGGKRFFRMAPIHHHFEKLGYHETTISVRFILITVAASLAAIGLAALD